MTTPIVQLRNVTKRIGSKTIIDDLTFDVPQGEVFGFLGPNGAGKTTTIRMMVGLISMTKGEILIHGHSISKNFEQAIRHVGAIVENPEMYKFLTGADNLKHYARMIPGITKARIQEVIDLVGLQNRIDEKVKTYSLGMRQRLGVAQALLHRPSLLILDEPTNGLDPAGIRELRDYLRRLAKEEGIAIVVSSHLLSEMELMCDRVAIIQQGKLIDVRHIREEGVLQTGAITSLDVDQPAHAAEAVNMWNDTLNAAAVEGMLQVVAEREQIAELNAFLIKQGYKVYGIRTVTKSLEDQFLEMTGSDPIG
ncbi:bacitracin ABC transporter ATP-binding protein [Paenibacillus swuensis]|uniref:Bacitracin ABC transporter ATP-binding protein n=1 Tax=Paenibacillus swuensis TaxID=1178515 RepID=A0A172TJ71_9BACL|nr:ABC transporter ATP-binding protein [Paenibacillus swuensis]ANE47012.1 bacitracin ABC transporter ATP-binding protein [Paenibacillus swuensis]